MLSGLPMVGGPVLHQTRNNMNKCIAFVDDDERFLDQSREHLTYRGYDVLGYRDSRTAFDAILRQKNRIDGICVDLELCGSPEQGAELVWHLRMNGVTAPIFALTNNLAGETEYALLKNGADDYIRKDHNFYPALLVRFEKFWEEHGACGSCLVRGALRYDRSSRLVSYRGKTEKTPLDVALDKVLEALMKHAGDVVTHEQLAEALEDRTATTGKIQKLVSALRSVLEGLGLADVIRTERGIGYALEACN